jgi:large subunit ribosomal protein L33
VPERLRTSSSKFLRRETADAGRKGNQVMREIITLQCGDCKNRNYTTTKNKKKHTERMETKKFCNTCRKQTAHKEVK